MQVFKSGSINSDIEPTLGLDREEWKTAHTNLRNLRQRVKADQHPVKDTPLTSAELRDSIPSQEVCDALVDSYLRTFGRIYPDCRIRVELRRQDKLVDSVKNSTLSKVKKLPTQATNFPSSFPRSCYADQQG